MKPHAMFLRESCSLPDGFILPRDRFCPNWTLVDDLTATAVDARIRRAGWHFMWMLGSCCRHGCGWTQKAAVHHALERALNRTASQFNASELDSFAVRKIFGIFMAKVVLHPRLIQHRTSLDTPIA